LRLKSLVQRPSVALGVALVALFMSLGGAGYAATQLAANSVGTDQIRNNAVTYQKIEPNSVGRVRLADGGVVNSKLAKQSVSFDKIQPQAVGKVRANLNQLQARVTGTCTGGSAIGAIDNQGKTTCNSIRAAEFGTSNASPVTITGTPTNLATLNLPAGSTYMAFANPTVTVTSGANNQRVTVSCTMTVGNATSTRKVVVPTAGTPGDSSTASIPLQLAGPAGTSAVSCAASLPGNGTLPTITSDTSINALQTASNS
jgi:hypothetical protein